MSLIQEITVDLVPSFIQMPVVYCSQYDDNIRQVSLTVMDNGTAFNVTSYDIYIEGTKPDKHGFSYPLSEVGTASGNNVTFSIQLQMCAVPGMTRMELVLRSGDNRVGTANFMLAVERAGLQDDTNTSDSELAPYIDGAQAAMRRAEAAADEAEDHVEDAEAWAIGKRNGQDVESDDETYHNNSKYYADQVADEVTGFQAEIDALDDRIDGINLSYYETTNPITHAKTEVGISLAKDGQYSDVAIWGTNSTIPEATTSKNGWMSAQDKTDLSNAKSNITTLQNKVSTLEGEMDTAQDDLSDLLSAISDLQENTEIGLFGAKWDRLTNRLTRLYGAKGITTDTSNFGHFGSINANYDNPFDNIYPWSDMFVCDVDLTLYRTGTNSLKDCVTAVYGDPDFTYEGDADTFVGRYRPKFWYKAEEDADGNVYYYVSQIEREGFAFSDEAIDGVGFCVDAGNNKEISGAGIPHTNIAVSTIHSRAKSSGFTLRDIFAVDAITTLYLVEYANWNSQQAIGDGCSSCYRQNAEDVIANVATNNGVTTFTVPYVSALVNLLVTGSQLSFGASSGSTTYKAIVTEASNDGTNFTVSLDREIAITNGMIMSVHGFSSCEFNLLSESVGNASGYIGQNGRANAYYRGSIMYANRYQYTLGIYRQAQTNHLWIADEVDPDDYDALNTSVHTDTGVALPDVSAAWLTVGGNAQRVTGLQSFLATGTSSGSSTSPVGDQQYVPAITAGNTILLFGCLAGGGWYCGLAGGIWDNSSGTSYWNSSAAPLLKNPL